MDFLLGKAGLAFHQIPDAQRTWVLGAVPRVRFWEERQGFKPDVLMTFGMPMSDHLFGLAYPGVPWIAHFSDPWTDSPFKAHIGPMERQMEAEVFAKADALVFTSQETLELVMAKYGEAYLAKAHVIPHGHLVQPEEEAEPGYVLRSIGSFYGPRSPRPLFEAVERLAPGLLEGVRIELVGPLGEHAGLLEAYPAARRVIRLVGSVGYQESLALMRRASALLLIDAPAARSVFFPSKLAEYIGANRYIFAITPPGTSARIVADVGGTVVDPTDVDGIMAGLERLLRERPERLPRPTTAYTEGAVAAQVNALVRSLAR
jgi:hypothetical protein